MQPYTPHYPPDDEQPPEWIYAFMPSYSGKALLAFVLYFFGYLLRPLYAWPLIETPLCI